MNSFLAEVIPVHYQCVYSSKVTAPQDAHRSLVLQVYLGSNTLEFSAIRRVKSLLVAFRENATQLQDLDIVLQIYLK